MATCSSRPRRVDPYKNFKFRVKWDGQLRRRGQQGQRRSSAPPRWSSTATAAIRSRSTSRRAGPSTTPITLERGVTHDLSFEQWAEQGLELRSAAGGVRVVAGGLPQGHHHRLLQRGGPAGDRPTRSTAAGCRSTRRCPTSTPTPTRSPSSTSSWRTRAGSGILASRRRPPCRSMTRRRDRWPTLRNWGC